MLSPDRQWGGLVVLGFVQELFQESPCTSFTRQEVVDLVKILMQDPELFDARVQAEYRIATAAVDAAAGKMRN